MADAFPNYSICGLPFYVSGETPDWRQLGHWTEFEGIELLRNHRAQAFDPSGRTVAVTDDSARDKRIPYDVLLIATGARPIIPLIPGIDTPGVFPLHTMEDSFRVHRYLAENAPQSAMVLVAVGVEPNAVIGEKAGLRTGSKGALCVSRRMETDIAGVYAAGDCVETWHRLLGAYTYLPLGTTSHKQGRVAGENAVGGSRKFQGSLGTQVVKVFDLAIARTGLRADEARKAGFEPSTAESRHFDHKAYYPGARQVCISVTGDRVTGRLLGAQMLGHWQAEVAKRIDVYATALSHCMEVEGLNDLDLSYTPPFSSPWDPVQMAAQAWGRTAA